MKKIFNPGTIPFIVCGSGIVGILLRIWTFGDGEDKFGLYPRMTLAWWALGLFSALVVAAVVFSLRSLDGAETHSENYNRSIIGGIGYFLVGAAMIYCSYQQSQGLMNGATDLITVYAGYAAGAVMIALEVFRILGKKPFFMLHGFVCLYLGLRLFNHCHVWSNEPQIGVIIAPFLASIVLMLVMYHRTCFDVDMGNPSKYMMFSMVGVYLCLVSTQSFEEVVLYAAWIVWLMSNQCKVRPLSQVENGAPGGDLEDGQKEQNSLAEE